MRRNSNVGRDVEHVCEGTGGDTAARARWPCRIASAATLRRSCDEVVGLTGQGPTSLPRHDFEGGTTPGLGGGGVWGWCWGVWGGRAINPARKRHPHRASFFLTRHESGERAERARPLTKHLEDAGFRRSRGGRRRMKRILFLPLRCTAPRVQRPMQGLPDGGVRGRSGFCVGRSRLATRRQPAGGLFAGARREPGVPAGTRPSAFTPGRPPPPQPSACARERRRQATEAAAMHSDRVAAGRRLQRSRHLGREHPRCGAHVRGRG